MLQTTMVWKSNAQGGSSNQNFPAGPGSDQVIVKVPFMPDASWPGCVQ